MDKTSISVPALQRMLGLKKGAAYWLIKQGHFEVIIVGKKMRVILDSFEKCAHPNSTTRRLTAPHQDRNTPIPFRPVKSEPSLVWRDAGYTSF